MKKIIIILLAISLVFSFSSICIADGHPEVVPAEDTKDQVILVSKCARWPIYSKDIADCFRCHNKDMTLKEIPLGAGTEFEGDIGEENGIKFIRLRVDGMDEYVPKSIKEIAEYIEWHPEFKKVKIHIRSYGGSLFDCWDAIGIINEMKEKGIIVETYSYGYSMSAGFVIFTSGSIGYRYASKTTTFMWHELRSGEYFALNTPSSLRDKARTFKKLQDDIHNYLSRRSNGKLTKDFLDKVVDKDELWINGEEMFKNGLADKLIETKER